jgi:iron-sulfur cluster repair protein YtfE (RIC family)
MELIDVMRKDHALLRSALKSLEAHLGPGCRCGWEDRVELDPVEFHKDLETLFRALQKHKTFEEKLVARWLKPSRTSDDSMEKMLLERHGSIDSLVKLFSIVTALIADGHVHSTRTILARLREELTRHLEEEEEGLFPRLRHRQGAGASSGA